MDITPYLPDFIKRIPSHMDFHGQRRAERSFQVIIMTFAVSICELLVLMRYLLTVGFVWGYICQQFSQTMYILIAGFVISCVLTLPPWPMYRKNPLKWQKARPDAEEVSSSSTPQSSSQKKKRK